MEYCSAIEKNEIMPFVATWMELEIIILSEVSRTNVYHLNVEAKKVNLFTKQKQTHRLQKQTWLLKATVAGRDGLRIWDWHMHTIIYEMDG